MALQLYLGKLADELFQLKLNDAIPTILHRLCHNNSEKICNLERLEGVPKKDLAHVENFFSFS